MFAPHAQPTPQPPIYPQTPPVSSLIGLGGYQVNWPAFFARSAVYALVLWPFVRFVGGATAGRAAATSVLAGAGLTGVKLAFDAAGVLSVARSAPSLDLGSAPNVIDVTGHTTYQGRG